MTVMNSIKENIKEEDKIVALENCFHTWDGSEVDVPGMVAGIQDRIRLLGYSGEPEIKIERLSVDEVSLTINFGMEAIQLFVNKDGWVEGSIGMHLSDLFHEHEKKVIRKTLLTYYKGCC